MRLVSELGRRLAQLARAGLDPFEPVRPPAAGVLRGILPPGLRSALARRVRPEERLRITGRVEEALNVATVGEHEGRALSVEFCRLVAPLPWRDVVGEAGDDVAVEIDAPHVDRRAAHAEEPGPYERIGADEVEEVGVQLRRKARRVAVPVEDVEGGRRI